MIRVFIQNMAACRNGAKTLYVLYRLASVHMHFCHRAYDFFQDKQDMRGKTLMVMQSLDLP